jgi:hypothetical protein
MKQRMNMDTHGHALVRDRHSRAGGNDESLPLYPCSSVSIRGSNIFVSVNAL